MNSGGGWDTGTQDWNDSGAAAADNFGATTGETVENNGFGDANGDVTEDAGGGSGGTDTCHNCGQTGVCLQVLCCKLQANGAALSPGLSRTSKRRWCLLQLWRRRVSLRSSTRTWLNFHTVTQKPSVQIHASSLGPVAHVERKIGLRFCGTHKHADKIYAIVGATVQMP